MRLLVLKYYFRYYRWSDFIPTYLILLEFVLPVRMTVFPVLLMVNTFVSFDSMSPLSYERVYLCNFPLIEAVKINNLALFATGSISYLLVAASVNLVDWASGGKSHPHLFYDFVPILVWAIAFGNFTILFMNGSSRSNRGWLIARAVFLVVITLIGSVVVQSGYPVFFSILVIGAAIIFYSYTLLKERK